MRQGTFNAALESFSVGHLLWSSWSPLRSFTRETPLEPTKVSFANG